MSTDFEGIYTDLSNLIEIDFEFYKTHHSDLSNLTEEHLSQHYSAHGYWEGRPASKYCYRDEFIKFAPKKTLELGPFNSPLIVGGDIKYFDVLSKEELVKRAKEIGISQEKIPHIHYVSDSGDLGVIDEKFNAIISSHNIEHQPDLITHFKNVAKILNDDGKYYLIVPHSNYCFDAALPESKISDIFNAYYERRTLHTIGSVIEHFGMTIHNNTQKHWDDTQQIKDKSKVRILNPAQISSALKTYNANIGTYIDVHAWQFTPISFSNILNCLIEMREIPFSKVRVFGQIKGSNEFTAIIEK